MLFANYCKACKELIFFIWEEFFCIIFLKAYAPSSIYHHIGFHFVIFPIIFHMLYGMMILFDTNNDDDSGML